MSNERKLKEGAATFYIYDKNLHHKDNDPFLLWLKDEGFKVELFGHSNVDNAIYVNINSKVYTWGMAGVGLCPVVGNHAIHIDEFKQIYGIFKKYSNFVFSIYTEEEQKKYDEYMAMIPIWEEQAKRAKEEYFALNPTFEKWISDVADCIVNDPWYKEHRPDYSKEEILKVAEDPWYKKLLVGYFREQDMPANIASEWDIITM
ncbi:hypothetical protein SAMN04487770_12343 [Butyrivibrio sp. ob235]|uniref:hypothetical protein n=1 Tax=Butyrivibrio sp. ob235 TaxID=1761780 RepID=UPI0008C917F2|nr:hypothetical protein [Butyrivibrio sp. ob235]SEM01138.1 hypothetical protein SAMN04487770_12343 [Butyrivibrio sp. ob235]